MKRFKKAFATRVNDWRHHIAIQKLLSSFSCDFPVVLEKTLKKLVELKRKLNINTSLILVEIIKWKKKERSTEIETIFDKTAIDDWSDFNKLEKIDLIIDLLFSWLVENIKSLISISNLNKILQNVKLNDKINNVICYPDSFSISNRKSVLESIKFALEPQEYQVLMTIADFFLFLYKNKEEQQRELISEAILSVSSLLLGNKNSREVENNIFEIELFSRIVKISILVKSFEDEVSEFSGSSWTNQKYKDNKSLDLPASFTASNIEDKDFGSKLPKKRNSDSSFKSLVSLLQPLKSSNYIKSKFGSNVTDFLRLYSEKSSSIINVERRNSAGANQLQIPLSRFEMREDMSDLNEEVPKIDIISSKLSNTTLGLFHTVTKKIRLNEKISFKSLKDKSMEKENVPRRNKHFKTGKTKAVIEMGEDEDESFEDELVCESGGSNKN